MTADAQETFRQLPRDQQEIVAQLAVQMANMRVNVRAEWVRAEWCWALQRALGAADPQERKGLALARELAGEVPTQLGGWARLLRTLVEVVLAARAPEVAG